MNFQKNFSDMDESEVIRGLATVEKEQEEVDQAISVLRDQHAHLGRQLHELHHRREQIWRDKVEAAK